MPDINENRPGYKKTKVGWIPEEWEVLKLGQIASFRNGKAHEQYIADDGKFILVNSKFVSTEGEVFKKTNELLSPLKENEIAMVMSDVPNGKAIAKCFYVENDGLYTLNQRICAIKAKRVVPKYLFYSLNRNSYYLRFDSGVGQTNLRKDQVLSCPIKVPPIPEQKKIAAILSTWDTAIQKLEQLIAKKQELKRGLMQQLLTGRRRFPEFVPAGGTQYKETKLGLVPVEWEVVELKDTAAKEKWSITGGPFGSNLKVSDYTTEGVRILQLQNIGDGKFIDNNDIRTSIKKADELLSCNIYPGEIIISKMGDPVARACFIPNSEDRYVMASDGIRLKTNDLKWDRRFVLETINSPLIRKIAIRRSIGSTRQRISLDDLKSIPFIKPSLPEQRKIAHILTVCDQDITHLEQEKKRLQLQKKGLMQQLLTGAVRVNTIVSQT